MVDAQGSELERRLQDARRQLDALRADAARTEHPGDDVQAEPGHGQDTEGQIHVTAAQGRVTRLELDPRVLRLEPERIGERITEAVNAALDDMRSKATAEQTPSVDLTALLASLRDVQEQGLRQMALISQGIENAVARIQAGIRRAQAR